MNEGDVVLTPLPQADGKIKNRPPSPCVACRHTAIGSFAV